MNHITLKQKTAKGLIWGGIGSGGMQLLNLAFGICLSNILSPADYGMIGSLAIFSAIASIFTESGFTLAIVNRRNMNSTDYSSVFWFNVIAGIMFYLLLFFLAVPISRFYSTPQMVPLARFLFLSFFIGALGTVPAAYLFRHLQVRQRSNILLISVAVAGCAGVGCALAGMGAWGIAVQTVTYSTVLTVLLWHRMAWCPKFILSIASLRDMLPFSLRQMVVAVFTHINNNFFSMILGRFYGMQPTGYYTQGNKWTTMGQSTLSGMVNSVGQPVMRQTDGDTERLQRVFRKMLRFAAFIGFPAMLGLAAVSHELIIITVTAKWLPAVNVMQILCIGGAFAPIATLYGNLFNSINRPGVYMWNCISQGAIQMVLLLITYRFDLTVMLSAYTAVNVGWIIIWQICARRAIGLKFIHVIKDIMPYFICASVSVASAIASASAVSSEILSLITKISVAVAVYCSLMWLCGSAMFRETIAYLRQRK